MNNTKKKARLSMLTVVGLCCALLSTQTYALEKKVFYHNNLLGSPVAATDENGNLCWREDYRPYGEKIRNEDQGCGLDDNVTGFTGHVHDKDIGLTYMQARYYDPIVGRFMGVDPVGFTASNPVSFGRYIYGNNNPYKYTDPNGKFGIIGGLIGAAIEATSQILSNGKITSWRSVAVMGLVGMVTGGVGAELASMAAKGAISVGAAVTGTGLFGANMSGIGTMAVNAMNGQVASTSEVGIAMIGGGFGSSAGAYLTSGFARTLGRGFGTLNFHISDITRGAMFGNYSEASPSIGQRFGDIALNTILNVIGKTQTNDNNSNIPTHDQHSAGADGSAGMCGPNWGGTSSESEH